MIGDCACHGKMVPRPGLEATDPGADLLRKEGREGSMAVGLRKERRSGLAHLHLQAPGVLACAIRIAMQALRQTDHSSF